MYFDLDCSWLLLLLSDKEISNRIFLMAVVLTTYRFASIHTGSLLATTSKMYLYENIYLHLYPPPPLQMSHTRETELPAFSVGLTVLPDGTGKVCSIRCTYCRILNRRCHSKGHASSPWKDPWTPPSGHLRTAKGDSCAAQINLWRKVISNWLWTNTFVKYSKKLLEKLYKNTSHNF